MLAIKMPHTKHENHLCYLHNVGYVQNNMDVWKKLVREGQFVCATCGRVARDADNLCNPQKL